MHRMTLNNKSLQSLSAKNCLITTICSLFCNFTWRYDLLSCINWSNDRFPPRGWPLISIFDHLTSWTPDSYLLDSIRSCRRDVGSIGSKGSWFKFAIFGAQTCGQLNCLSTVKLLYDCPESAISGVETEWGTRIPDCMSWGKAIRDSERLHLLLRLRMPVGLIGALQSEDLISQLNSPTALSPFTSAFNFNFCVFVVRQMREED